MRDFLRYIVDSTLEGNSQHLKESVIGVHVFQRAIGYDPKLDPAVRMGAQRLRRKLLAFYAASSSSPLQIILPKGSYIPQFVPAESPAADPPTSPTELGEVPIEDLDPGPENSVPKRRWRVWIVALGMVVLLLAVYPIAKFANVLFAKRTKTEYNRVIPFTAFPFDEYGATFSPDGSEVAYSWSGPKEENVDLYIQRIDESAPHRLTTDPGRDEFATWSPDGRWIAFRRNLHTVMIVSPLGAQERNLGQADGFYLTWVPDGTAVIVPKAHPGSGEFDLETISVATGERHSFTLAGRRVSGGQPFRFSPDGRYFGYCARPQESLENEIYIRSVDGGSPLEITHTQRVIQGWTWTPNSHELIFSSNINGPYALWRIPAKPNAKEELVAGTGQDALFPEMASYSASRMARVSNLLVYERWQRVLNMEEQDVTTDRRTGLKRAGPPQPIFPSTRDDNSPQISPDGRELVFISNRSGFDEIWRGDLAQSQEPQLLTSLGSSGLYPHFPHWSPDGHFIVFSAAATSIRNVEGSVGHDISQIYVIPVEGPGPMRRLTAWNSEQTHPTWSSNGRWIYFASNRSGKFELWKLPSDAPVAVKGDDNMMAALQLTHHGCTAGQESLDGETLFMKREDWSEGPVWAQAIEADPDSAKLVTLNAFTREWWSPSNRGIFYVDTSNATRADLPSTAPKPIFFFDWRTRQSSKIGEIRERFFVFRPDFCASPDGKKLIYTQFVIKNIDLMLVRDFY